MSVVSAPSQSTPTATESDPQTLGWMKGFPPRPDRTISFQNGSFRSFPELRWAWSNVSHNAHGAYMARGVHGQGIYIDPKAEMVIARYASHPSAGNAANDPVTLPACMALAKELIAGG